VSKATGAELLTHFNAGLRALHASGRYQRMVGGRGLIRQLARLRFLTEDNAPLNYVLEDRVAGASVAVVEAILNNLESSVTVHDIKVLPWARAYQELQAAEDAVLFSIVQTPERKPLFQWAGPIYRSNVVLFGRRADKLSGRRLKDFAGQVICAVRDDVGAQILAAEEHPQDLIYLVPHADYCARMLAVGRVGLWAFGRDTGFWHLRHNGQSADDFEVLLQLRESNRFIAFSRAVPSEVVQAFQQEIDVLHLSGGLDRLIETSLQQAEHRVRSTPTP
jgi:polar amino acid transport system substrate-binding protein